jgi:hypothetical protein
MRQSMVIAASLLGVVLSGCSAEEGEEELGSVGLAVVATGSDGATYRLTPGTRIGLFREAPQFIWDQSLDGDSSVVTIRLPPGTYLAEIFHDTGYTTTWPLERTLGGETTTVMADLLTAQPATVAVAANASTSLIFEFRLPTGPVTFGRGNLDVSINVADPATSFDSSFTTSDLAVTSVFVASEGPHAAALTSALPTAGTSGLGVSISMALTGPWQEGGGDEALTSICAPVTVTQNVGTGHAGFADAIAEAGHGDAPGFLFGPASVCVFDYGTFNRIRFRTSRAGAGETATFSGIGGDFTWFHVFYGDLPERVYDFQNATFDVDALMDQSGSLSMSGNVRVLDPTGALMWYNAAVSGTMAFSFTGD